jgi:hypothetical protein
MSSTIAIVWGSHFASHVVLQPVTEGQNFEDGGSQTLGLYCIYVCTSTLAPSHTATACAREQVNKQGKGLACPVARNVTLVVMVCFVEDDVSE